VTAIHAQCIAKHIRRQYQMMEELIAGSL
jgi:hypothetical protein